MKRTLLFLFAMLSMAYSTDIQAQNVWDGTVATTFAGGSGTEADPYLIADGAQLARFAAIVNGTNGMTQNSAACGKLTANIALNNISNWKNWNENTLGMHNWTPIGSGQFTGILDGQGYSVSGIFINNDNSYQGLVGNLGESGCIKNIGVTESYIKGYSYIGGVCGANNGGTLSYCHNTGKVKGTDIYVGGVCGRNYNGGIVTNCYNTGKVNGGGEEIYVGYVGGICGQNYGTLTQSYNTGEITGANDYVGGVCGTNEETLTNCYNKGDVTGYKNVGGVCGFNFNNMTNCYSTGDITGERNIGGVCGTNGRYIDNCYYFTYCGATGAGSPKEAIEFGSGEVAWLLQGNQTEQIWGQIIGIDSHPVLGGMKVVQKNGNYINELNNKDGEYYLISNATELNIFASMVNNGQTNIKGRLTADIVLNNISNWESWNENTTGLNSWTPIGSGSQPFTGTLDGDGHSVSGIYINSGTDYQGLVGVLGEGGTLQNLGVKASYIKGGYYVGGLCGWNTGNVTNCYNIGSVEGNEIVGGLCGQNYATVTNCYNSGSVEGNYSVGGVCGNSWGNVTNCYNTGNVEGNEIVGGVCGWNDMGSITNCYNTGSVEGNYSVGGVCGNSWGNVTNCYYQKDMAAGGINGSDAAGQAEVKTAEQFQSGEVAWLLQNGQTEQVWGQAIGTDESPVWQTEGNKVYKLTLQNGEEANALYANSGNFTLPAPAEREGYTFAGWFTAQADGTQVQDDATLTADLTLYAQWTANSYTVTFEANGGEGSMNQQTFTYDVKQTLTPNAFTRTGYSFTGWNTQADGNGSTYGDEAEILNLTTEANGSITLYAQWSINSYTIRFVNADGTVLQSSEVEYGQTPAYNGETPTKESTAEFDYTFAGWTPQIANVTEEAIYKATYTATKRSYTLTVALAEGCEGMGEVSGSGSYEYGTVVTLTAIAHEGYKFMQWSDGDTNATRTIIMEGDMTLTATFEAEGGSETGLEEQMADTFQVIGMERSMRIEGSEQEACVFNTAGQLIYRGTKRIIEVHAAGIYLVRIGNETKRVMVR